MIFFLLLELLSELFWLAVEVVEVGDGEKSDHEEEVFWLGGFAQL